MFVLRIRGVPHSQLTTGQVVPSNLRFPRRAKNIESRSPLYWLIASLTMIRVRPLALNCALEFRRTLMGERSTPLQQEVSSDYGSGFTPQVTGAQPKRRLTCRDLSTFRVIDGCFRRLSVWFRRLAVWFRLIVAGLLELLARCPF